MANKTRKIDFNKERLYEALQMNGINSVRELCGVNDTLCYGGEFVSRKTIERACQTGEISNRTLDILSKALDCTPEFFTAPDVIIKEDIDQCIVYMSDNKETLVKGKICIGVVIQILMISVYIDFMLIVLMGMASIW